MHTPSDSPGQSDPVWLDRLVDLHVLTVHGDLEAAATARRWLTRDSHARDVWQQVESTCAQIRAQQQPEGPDRR